MKPSRKFKIVSACPGVRKNLSSLDRKENKFDRKGAPTLFYFSTKNNRVDFRLQLQLYITALKILVSTTLNGTYKATSQIDFNI